MEAWFDVSWLKNMLAAVNVLRNTNSVTYNANEWCWAKLLQTIHVIIIGMRNNPF